MTDDRTGNYDFSFPRESFPREASREAKEKADIVADRQKYEALVGYNSRIDMALYRAKLITRTVDIDASATYDSDMAREGAIIPSEISNLIPLGDAGETTTDGQTHGFARITFEYSAPSVWEKRGLRKRLVAGPVRLDYFVIDFLTGTAEAEDLTQKETLINPPKLLPDLEGTLILMNLMPFKWDEFNIRNAKLVGLEAALAFIEEKLSIAPTDGLEVPETALAEA